MFKPGGNYYNVRYTSCFPVNRGLYADLEMRNLRTYTLVYLTIPVAVQQNASNIAGIETCSYRESNICSSLLLIACYYRTYWTGRTDMGKMSDTASRRVFVI